MGREAGLILVTVGLILVVVSVASLLQFFPQPGSQCGASFGWILMIGPIPIVFGLSPEMAAASMILAVALMAISFLLFRNTKGQSDEIEGSVRIERSAKSMRGEKSVKSEEAEGTCVKGGAVVMIGPIPIVIGSDPGIALFMMLIALTAMVLWILWSSSGADRKMIENGPEFDFFAMTTSIARALHLT